MMNPAQWAQGAFQIPANATPDQIRRKREILAEMIMGQGRPQYVGEGLADGVSKAFAGWQTGKVNKFEGDARRKANDAFTAMLGQTPVPTGPLSVLGMDPAWNGGQPFAEPGTPAPDQTPSTFGVEPGRYASAAAPFEAGKPFGITPGVAPGAAVPPDALIEGLVSRGLPRHVAEGFAMNAQDESGLNPGINEASPLVPGSRGGFGLMQWTGPRRKQLEAFAAERGASVSDPNVQMDFLMTELQGPERAAARSILAAPDAGAAGAAIVNDFLRPAEEHRARRVAEYTGGAAAAPSGPQAAMPGFQVPQAPAYSGPPVAALQEALANPWLDDASKQIAAQMLEQAQQAADPMRQLQMQQGQLGLQKAQMEIAQMGQPEAMSPYQQAQLDMEAQRLEMARQAASQVDQPASVDEYEYYTRQEMAAGREPMPYAQFSVEKARAGASNVSVSTGNGSKFTDKSDELAAGRMSEIVAGGQSASAMLGDMQQLAQLATQINTGKGAQVTAALGPYAEMLGVKIDGLPEAQAYESIISRLAPQMRPIGGGASSDFDAKQFLRSLPALGNSPEGNAIINQTFQGIQQHKLAAADIAQQAQRGAITWQEADSRIAALGSPFEAFNAYNKTVPSPARATPPDSLGGFYDRAIGGGGPAPADDDDALIKKYGG